MEHSLTVDGNMTLQGVLDGIKDLPDDDTILLTGYMAGYTRLPDGMVTVGFLRQLIGVASALFWEHRYDPVKSLGWRG